MEPLQKILAPIQQGLADLNPDVDAIYRLTQPLPVSFQKEPKRIALGHGSICPFNSQNTTWFREAFPLMYLPSYCSFRMTDIWRSFVAQRIAWTCGWNILFHEATVWQERNEHAIIKDFKDEISGYCNNREIMDRLMQLDLKERIEHTLAGGNPVGNDGKIEAFAFVLAKLVEIHTAIFSRYARSTA